MAKDFQSLWPREHGAYAQLAVAMACGTALGHGSRGIAQALLTFFLFLASEPVLVLMGRRGPEARGSSQVRAALRLLILGSLAILAVLNAWVGAPAGHFLALLPPAILGAVLFLLFLLKLERTAAGEVVAAWTFSTAAGAVALLGGAGLHRANLLVLFLGGMFTLATATVHCHLLALKRGGDARPRLAAFLGGALLTLAAFWLGRHAGLRRNGFGVFLPMALAALWVWLAPPEPRQLKKLGWAATLCALAGGGLAVFYLW